MSLALLEEEITGAVERLSDQVVRVQTVSALAAGGRRAPPAGSAGSGIIVDRSGFVATNAHVVREAREIHVTLRDGREFPGRLLGSDPQVDVALIRVDAGLLPEATLVDSTRLRVGQIVLAVGNSLGLPGGPTVSTGVLSAVGRAMPFSTYVLEGLLQTDAAINPGNSGGPLADRLGGVIGLNTAMIPYAQGVGFAVPSNTVRWAVDQIRRFGRVVRPHLGISGVTVSPLLARQEKLLRDRGILVLEVSPGGAAARAGIVPGDVLSRLGGGEVDGMRELLEALASAPVGSDISLAYHRGSVERWTQLHLEESDAPAVG